MSDRGLRILAWALWASLLALFPLSLLFGAADDDLFILALFASGTVGTLILNRHPRHTVGWLLVALAVGMGFSIFAEGYSEAVKTPPFRPGTTFASWISTWASSSWIVVAAVFLPLVFPDGSVPRRWRWVLWLGVFALVAGSVGEALKAGALDADVKPPLQNPVGIGGVGGDVLKVLGALGTIAIVPSIIGAGAAITVPFEGVGVADVIGGIGWVTGLLTLAFGLPAAAGIAVFKYRLYDIDVVIRRTLVYAGLTAILAAAYLGSVLLLQLALDPLTSGSSLAVAVSTLAVAALFRPARARIQAAVDRRFYRRRYDAAATLEQFSSSVRQQVDLDALGGELRAVVADTMQPAHVSLWLRGARR